MIGKATYEKYAGGVNKSTVYGAGGFGAGLANALLMNKGDGSGTDRSTYAFNPSMHAPLNKDEKSFASPGGQNSGAAPTHGAVGALNLASAGLAGGAGGLPAHLNNSYVMKNILSTPSSGKSKSGISE